MVPLAAGSVILVPFPFSDLSRSKLRPAVVLADAKRGDWILCQVTSKPYADPDAVLLRATISPLVLCNWTATLGLGSFIHGTSGLSGG